MSTFHVEEVEDDVNQYGLLHIEKSLRKKLEEVELKEVEIKVAVTGDSGAGKSSFINAIRGLRENGATSSTTEASSEPRCYDHPTCPKVKFWDLPGIGTPSYPNVETYFARAQLEKYDMYLIFACGRFSENNVRLAELIQSINKKFILVRAKIDQDIDNARHDEMHLFSESSTLQKIRSDCSENLKGTESNLIDIYLISNRYPAKWDFGRLSQAVLDILPNLQRESLKLSLEVASTKMLQGDVRILKRRVWYVAAASAAAAFIPVPGAATAADLILILREINFYRSLLDLPKDGSHKFSLLSLATQNEIKATSDNFSTLRLGSVWLLAAYISVQAVTEVVRFVPSLGMGVASAIAMCSTNYFLKSWLKRIENTALLVLKETLNNFQID